MYVVNLIESKVREKIILEVAALGDKKIFQDRFENEKKSIANLWTVVKFQLGLDFYVFLFTLVSFV